MAACAIYPINLLINSLSTPTVQTLPHFSWGLDVSPGATRNQTMSAYQLLCASEAGEVVWDSGRVSGSNSLQIPYDGHPLQSFQKVTVSITVWDRYGVQCASARTWFETALLKEADWRDAKWIARYPELPSIPDCDLYATSERNEAPRFRTEITVPSDTSSVRAYVAGLGYHRLFVDGYKVGHAELEPGWSVVERTVAYTAYDLDEHLILHRSPSSRHAIGLELGNGWWNPLPLRFWGHINVRASLLGRNGTREPMVRALVLARHANGSTSVLARTRPDGSWSSGGSPTTRNNIYLGEVYDGRLAAGSRGWATVGFDDATWTAPVAANSSGLGRLVVQDTPPVRSVALLGAKVLLVQTNVTDGTRRVLLDAGRNLAGVCTWKVRGPEGSVVRMRYGELLEPGGQRVNVMTSVAGQVKAPNPEAPCQPHVAYQGDQLTLSGAAEGDEFTPAYSWHGFRYIEVELPIGAELIGPNDGLGAVCFAMRTDVKLVAHFASSDPRLGHLRTLARNTYDSNLMGLQSDCPHRERFGYGGDALGCGEAGLSIYDFAAFYAKRVRDFNDAQRQGPPGSGLGGFTETAPFVGISDGGVGPAGSGPIGWQTFQPEAQLWLYRYYGDIRSMKDAFNATYAFIRMLDTDPSAVETGLGDWMPAEATSPAFTGLGFKRMAYLAFANISHVLGHEQLAKRYRGYAAAVTTTINDRFLDRGTGAYLAKEGHQNDSTQTSQGMALFQHICPTHDVCLKALGLLADKARRASYLPGACRGAASLQGCQGAEGGPGAHLTAGLFGIKWVLMALADGGLNDLAYEMLSSDSYPSYHWMMNNPFANATTIWESWFFSDDTYSHNHPMFGSSEVWLMQSVLGIQPHPAARGMDRVLIKPSPPRALQNASGYFDTPRGRIAVSWAWRAADAFALNVSIPPNVQATVHVPCTSSMCLVRERGVLRQGGRRVAARTSDLGSSWVTEVGSGEYAFTVSGGDVTGSWGQIG